MPVFWHGSLSVLVQLPEGLFGQGIAIFCDKYLSNWVKPTLGARLVRLILRRCTLRLIHHAFA